jgi:hypothetical protein
MINPPLPKYLFHNNYKRTRPRDMLLGCKKSQNQIKRAFPSTEHITATITTTATAKPPSHNKNARLTPINLQNPQRSSAPNCFLPRKPPYPQFHPATSGSHGAVTSKTGKDAEFCLQMAGAAAPETPRCLDIDPRYRETAVGAYCLTGSSWIWGTRREEDGSQWREITFHIPKRRKCWTIWRVLHL